MPHFLGHIFLKSHDTSLYFKADLDLYSRVESFQFLSVRKIVI